MGKARQTGNLVSENLISVDTTNDTVQIGTGVTIYGGTAGIVSARQFSGNATNATDATNAANIGITNDVTTNATRYVNFTDGTSGNQNIFVSNTKLTYNPNTGTLNSTKLSVNSINANGELFENINIVPASLGFNQNINLDLGMIHYFTLNETIGICTANIRINSGTTLNSVMAVGDTAAVTIIITPDGVGYSTCIDIDGTYNPVKWTSGTIPSLASIGSTGSDIYSYQIIKTASSTFTVFGSTGNFS